MGIEENRSLYSNRGALRVEIMCRHTVRATLGRKKENRSVASSDPQEPRKCERGAVVPSGDKEKHADPLQLLLELRFNMTDNKKKKQKNGLLVATRGSVIM